VVQRWTVSLSANVWKDSSVGTFDLPHHRLNNTPDSLLRNGTFYELVQQAGLYVRVPQDVQVSYYLFGVDFHLAITTRRALCLDTRRRTAVVKALADNKRLLIVYTPRIVHRHECAYIAVRSVFADFRANGGNIYRAFIIC